MIVKLSSVVTRRKKEDETTGKKWMNGYINDWQPTRWLEMSVVCDNIGIVQVDLCRRKSVYYIT